jgi:hypothetical protein
VTLVIWNIGPPDLSARVTSISSPANRKTDMIKRTLPPAARARLNGAPTQAAPAAVESSQGSTALRADVIFDRPARGLVATRDVRLVDPGGQGHASIGQSRPLNG